MAFEPLRICLMGAECTGKTTLARALALHFSGLWVPDCRRSFSFFDQCGLTLKADDQAVVMRAQFEQEEKVVAHARQIGCHHVICDTAPLLTAIYSELYFADTSLYASAHALYGGYALTLVLIPDVGEAPDLLPHAVGKAGVAVHARVQHVLRSMHYPHIELSGQGERRLQAAIAAVETLTR